MSNFGDKVQPAVKKETKNVAIYTVVGVVVMWVGFLILHLIWPEKIPFDYRVILGGIGGGAVAVLNFFLMGMAVQKAVSETDEAGAKRRMQASYSQRNLMQMLWAVLAIVRCTNFFLHSSFFFCKYFCLTSISFADILILTYHTFISAYDYYTHRFTRLLLSSTNSCFKNKADA